MKTPKVIEETFLRTMKQVWIWNTTGRTELMILYCALLFLYIFSMDVANTSCLRSQTFKKSFSRSVLHTLIISYVGFLLLEIGAAFGAIS